MDGLATGWVETTADVLGVDATVEEVEELEEAAEEVAAETDAVPVVPPEVSGCDCEPQASTWK